MPPDWDEVLKMYSTRAWLFTNHGQERALIRRITEDEIEEAVLNGVVIEDYEGDKYGPSCLILGYTKAGRALHVQICYPPKDKVITAYDPDSEKWESDLRTRKKK